MITFSTPPPLARHFGRPQSELLTPPYTSNVNDTVLD